MRTLQITATVTDNHELTIQLPPEIPAGNYQIVLVMEEQPIQKQRKPFKFPVDDYGPLLTDLSLALIQPLLEEAQIQAQQEIRQQQLEIAKELLKERSQDLLQFVKSLDLDAKQLRQTEVNLGYFP